MFFQVLPWLLFRYSLEKGEHNFREKAIAPLNFAFAVANFHLTAFPPDFRKIHQLMDVHRHSYGITLGEKTGRK